VKSNKVAASPRRPVSAAAEADYAATMGSIMIKYSQARSWALRRMACKPVPEDRLPLPMKRVRLRVLPLIAQPC
jgi:hypothetical protein